MCKKHETYIYGVTKLIILIDLVIIGPFCGAIRSKMVNEVIQLFVSWVLLQKMDKEDWLCRLSKKYKCTSSLILLACTKPFVDNNTT